MRKYLLFLIFFVSLYPKIGYKMTLTTPFSATAQTSSSELYECEDDFGPYESSLPCEDTPCVTECDICHMSYPCDEDCPAFIFCPECNDYHHEGTCPKDHEPDISPIPDDSDDPENHNDDNGQGSTISTGAVLVPKGALIRG